MSGYERIFCIVAESITVTTVRDLFYVKASATNGLNLRRISLSASSVVSAAEINLRLKRLPANVTVGSGGSAPTIQRVQSRMPFAALSAARTNDTTQATTSGTAVILANWNWNVLMDFLEVPATVEERWNAEANEALVFEIATAAASTTLSGTMVFEEV